MSNKGPLYFTCVLGPSSKVIMKTLRGKEKDIYSRGQIRGVMVTSR